MTLEDHGVPVRTRGAALLVAVGLAWAALLAASTATAGDQKTLFGGNDWYGSVYGMLGVDNADVSGGEPSAGATLSMGFRFNRWFASELSGEWAQRFRYDRGDGPITCSNQESGRRSSRFTAWQVTAGGRLYFTDSMIQPFLLGHGGYIETRDSGGGRSCKGTGFVARLGGGVEIFVTNGLAVSLLGAYVLPTAGKAEDHDYVSVGLGFTWY